ncbi:hypothetical protein MMB17_10100 [Methylobacterium organophilum]|uniref:hypothetical protein n=1 Tax=Methylobacterium organophilum TaxID=410 RepID=UPI001F13888A|nr:hypothetical protein [Methylobacterium organophilum]UMY19617.1 hypothetical protein MMB17_10100 [Methylobacterium organophilum]
MRRLLDNLRAILRRAELPAGPIPLASGAMLSHEWLAPHLIRLPAGMPAPGTASGASDA